MSKFINKETEEYLKSKAGFNVQQQIQNVRERIELEGQMSQSQFLKNSQAINVINNDLESKEDQISRLETSSGQVYTKITDLDIRIDFLVKVATAAFLILGGLLAWVLVK